MMIRADEIRKITAHAQTRIADDTVQKAEAVLEKISTYVTSIAEAGVDMATIGLRHLMTEEIHFMDMAAARRYIIRTLRAAGYRAIWQSSNDFVLVLEW